MAAKKKDGIGDIIRTVVYAVLIAVAFRALAFQPFNIPSQSMVPTLLVGDYLFVSKYSYGYSRHSLPFSPNIFSGRIFETRPARGDVAVFKTPEDNRTDYIKRIVGLPGDRIQTRDGVLYINDKAVKRELVGRPIYYKGPTLQPVKVTEYREILPNGKSYSTYDESNYPMADNAGVYTVPAGHYFMMGDNRDNSSDSRFGAVGFVPAENLVGRAEILFFSHKGWRPRFDRFFDRIE